MLFSCGAFKKTPTEPPVIQPQEDVVVNPPDPDPPLVPKPPESTEELAYHKVYFRGYEFNAPLNKQDFNVAILLPFHIGLKTSQEQLRADYMLEYYQGVQLALQQIEELGAKFHVSIYDTKNDTLELKRILKKSELKKMDMIIGPTEQEQVSIAAYFARANKIPLFSPITVIDKCWTDNAYLYNLAPSNQMKARELISFIKQVHSDKTLIVVRDGKRFDKLFGEALVTELNAQTAVKYKIIDYGRLQSWRTLIGDGQYIVLHTSEDKGVINTVVTSLMPLKSHVCLFGSDKWMDFTSVDYSFWNQLNVHFLAGDLAELGNPQSNEMRRQFREMFNGDPSPFAYSGYDQMLFAGELLNAFGEYFPLFIENKTFEYSNTRFSLIKSNNCYQNKFLEIIAFQDSKLVSVNSAQ